MSQITRSAATRLTDDKRKAIALQALAGTEPISALAEHNGASRPTVYRQISTARAALDEAFDTARAADADQLLFMLPVTRP
jgi:DNA-directed RNA polymerase specialized sigma24 family protein